MSDLCKQTSVSPCASSPPWGPAHVGLSGLAHGVDVTTGRLRQKVPQSDSSEVVVCSSWGRSGKDAAGCSSHLQAGCPGPGPVMAQTSHTAAARPPAPLCSQAPTGLGTIGLAHGPWATGLDHGPCCSVFPFSYWQLYWKVMGSCCAGSTAPRPPFCTCGVSWCDPQGPGALRKPVSGDLRVAFYGFLSSPCWVVLGPHLLLTQISPLLFAAHLREEGGTMSGEACPGGGLPVPLTLPVTFACCLHPGALPPCPHMLGQSAPGLSQESHRWEDTPSPWGPQAVCTVLTGQSHTCKVLFQLVLSPSLMSSRH